LGGGVGIAPAPNSQFNYPAYTVETKSNVPVNVRWINDLKGDFGVGTTCLPHLLPIDQTLHWANPPGGPGHTDSHGDNPSPYAGPVPLVTHLHGAHVDPHSDGYPEAWWLPACNVPPEYATKGTHFDDATGGNPGNLGYADYIYRNDQPATTLWYHDHSLGMTRSNVYAGPAGFWLVRGGVFDRPTVKGTNKVAKLPGPAPKPGQSVLELNLPTSTVRRKIREIPIAIQDRSFDQDGSLFYPEKRAFFEGLNPSDLQIPFAPVSDVAPIWNPESFFNVMVVNGVAWPQLEVAPALYRFRFLNGCNSRFLWLKFDNAGVKAYQIGAGQGFLPAPVDMNILDLDGSGDGKAQLLMALAERADVIVDFRELADGTEIELLNIGPDEPFGGGIPGVNFTAADSGTTGKVMRFKVNSALLVPQDAKTTDPGQLALNAEPPLGPLTNPTPRKVSLNEEMSGDLNAAKGVYVCGNEDDEFAVPIQPVDPNADPTDVCPPGSPTIIPFGPVAAKLGTVNGSGSSATGNPLMWTDHTDANNFAKLVTLQSGATVTVNVTENPALGATEEWEIYNFTVDAHPIHLHLVRFEVMNRQIINGNSPNYVNQGSINEVLSPKEWETGFKDTVTAYPGEITRVKALFDIGGLYVWHCHIVEHEDNEMMRPYVVGLPDAPAPEPAAAPIPFGFGGR
jgi:FtsP/CotA-like multicopper oxidase with cupredoxin domain